MVNHSKTEQKGCHFVFLPFENQFFQNSCSSLGHFICKENLFIYIQRPMLAMVLFLNGPNHSKAEQNGCHFLTKCWPSCTIRKPNHSNSEPTLTIRNLNMFGIRAPHCTTSDRPIFDNFFNIGNNNILSPFKTLFSSLEK